MEQDSKAPMTAADMARRRWELADEDDARKVRVRAGQASGRVRRRKARLKKKGLTSD